MGEPHVQRLKGMENLVAGDNGQLFFSGCDMVALARRAGTPLYVMDESGIRARCARLRERFTQRYPDTRVYYASKAFSTLAMAQIVRDEGCGIDVVSGGELHTALKAGMDPALICFHGNNKTETEIALGLDAGVGRFVVDSFREMALIDALAQARGKRAGVLLRISPGIDAHTHAYLQTGVLDCKFGFPIAGGVARQAVKAVSEKPHLDFMGLHCHIGSQIFTAQAYLDAAAVMTDLAAELAAEMGIPCRELNLGGGFGIRYTEEDTPFDLFTVLDGMMETVAERCRHHGIPRPRIMIEPGRWLVGECGITLYTIGARKELAGVRTFISVDGGMTDNPRPALYQAVYQGIVANRLDEPETETVTVAGKCCESGDLLIRDSRVPETFEGDILAVLSTGAYTYSMSSNYNRTPKPPVYFVRDGEARLAVKREDFDDLIRNDIDLYPAV